MHGTPATHLAPVTRVDQFRAGGCLVSDRMLETRDTLADAIEAAELFRGLSSESRAALVNAARSVAVEPGEPLFPEGCGADALYVVREGVFHAVEPDPP